MQLVSHIYGGLDISPIDGGTIELKPEWNNVIIPILYGHWDKGANRLSHGDVEATIQNYILDQLDSLYTSYELIISLTYLNNYHVYDTTYNINSIVPSIPLAYYQNNKLFYQQIDIYNKLEDSLIICWGNYA